MELFVSDDHFVVLDSERSLWISRKDGSYQSRSGCDRSVLGMCLGTVYGFIGNVDFGGDNDRWLFFIQKRQVAGYIGGKKIFKINSVVPIPLTNEAEVVAERCELCEVPVLNPQSHEIGGLKGLNKIKVPPAPEYNKRQDKDFKLDKRMVDEMHKMFSEASSFYYSFDYDLSNTVQRKQANCDQSVSSLWKVVDERFFWNYYMVQPLINSKDEGLQSWIIPIIQGCFQTMKWDMKDVCPSLPSELLREQVQFTLISRRSRHRAGTRYLRRGVDENGKCANYVETEQILIFRGHTVSLVMTRGSVPVYWSQPGLKYRPPPVLERSKEDNFSAFKKHFDEEIKNYGTNVIINLVEKSGKEKILADAYLDYTLQYDSPEVIYAVFDFHEHCRGMRFENIQNLLEKLEQVIKDVGYCWIDSYGSVMEQKGVFRVNCVDCLDRTNVVQTHLAKNVLVLQLSKLGLLIPELGLSPTVKATFNLMWANNGDTISKQYAGTNALKGDFTRTGERKISGLMKDGVNSANRYYLNRFKDATRQAAIELMLGLRDTITEAELAQEKATDDKETTLEQLKAVIDDVSSRLIPKNDPIVGIWGLVDGKDNELLDLDIDIIMILTEKNYFVIGYDCTMDDLPPIEMVALADIDRIELSCIPVSQSSSFLGIFQSSTNPLKQFKFIPILKVHFNNGDDKQYHEFKCSNVRIFNNCTIVTIQNSEEMMDSLKALAESIKIAATKQNTTVEIAFLTDSSPEDSKKQRIPNIASSIVGKYLSMGNTDTNAGPRKLSVSSLGRFAPKYFRKSSEPFVEDGILKKEDVADGGIVPDENLSTKEKDVSSNKLCDDCLVIPSCGIIKLSDPASEGDGNLLLQLQEKSKLHLNKLNNGNYICQHRHSLPMGSLVPNRAGSLHSSTEGIAPEITITEDSASAPPMNQPVSPEVTSLSGTPYRICKSSNDVHDLCKEEESVTSSSDPGKLSPLRVEARSSSEQNLAPSMRSMKGSHSDTIIKLPPKVNAARSKREIVLAPLGKFAKGVQYLGANYLDPRKLRTTIKPSKLLDSMKRGELECDPELLQRIETFLLRKSVLIASTMFFTKKLPNEFVKPDKQRLQQHSCDLQY